MVDLEATTGTAWTTGAEWTATTGASWATKRPGAAAAQAKKAANTTCK